MTLVLVINLVLRLWEIGIISMTKHYAMHQSAVLGSNSTANFYQDQKSRFK